MNNSIKLLVLLILGSVGTALAFQTGIISQQPDKPSSLEKWIIIPGESVGFIHQESSEKELKRIYGNSYQSTFSERGNASVLFPNSPDQLIIIWTSNKRDAIEKIELSGSYGTKWSTKDGIRPGVELHELIAVNEGQFQFNGFEMDKPGLVTNWNGGKLASQLNGLEVFLDYDKRDELTELHIDAFKDNMRHASDAARIEYLNIYLGSIQMSF